MATVSSVKAVAERLDYLLLADGAPGRCIGDLRDGVVLLRSELLGIVSATDSINSMSAELKKEVTQLAYAIEDAVQSYTRQEAAYREKSGVHSCLFNCSSTHARSLRKDLHIFRERINEIKRYAERDVADSSISASFNAEPQRDEQRVPVCFNSEQSDLILGMEYERLRLMDDLIDETPELTVLPICGMGGIGKTTLARSLYNDPLVATHFDNWAWATAGREFRATKILEDILSCILGTSTDEISGLETMRLMERLQKSLKRKRYLVILDDVWSTEVWDTLKIAFPDDHNRSRIVMTTRLVEVSRYSATNIYEMQLLHEEQSWELFKLKYFKKNKPGTELGLEMENIGKQIVQQCRGLPLAISTISRVLRTMDFSDWVKVLEGMQRDQHLELAEDSLAQSYHSLPFHLKPCFLYLGHFPQIKLYQWKNCTDCGWQKGS